MPRAPTPAGLPSQTHQGGAARLVHRVRGALRGIVAGGIALTGRLRRKAAPNPTRGQRVLPRPPRPRREEMLFTPQAYPGLSPEACAFFNTPVDQCDPELLRLILPVLTRLIAGSLPAGLGIDADALFATLCKRLGDVAGETAPDAPAARTRGFVVMEAPPPDASPASQSPLAEALASEPADHAALALPAGAAAAPAVTAITVTAITDAAAAITASAITASAVAPICETAPGAAFLDSVWRHGLDARRSPPESRISLRLRHKTPAHRCHSPTLRALPERSDLPPRRLCYAACAGPP